TAGVCGRQHRPLGPVVVLHVAVEVEVVLAEVREAGDVDHDTVGPVQHQGMGGDLHRGGMHAVLDHAGQDAVQLGSLGGGADRGDVVVGAGGGTGRGRNIPAASFGRRP